MDNHRLLLFSIFTAVLVLSCLMWCGDSNDPTDQSNEKFANVGKIQNNGYELCMIPNKGYSDTLDDLVILGECDNKKSIWKMDMNGSIDNVSLDECLLPGMSVYGDRVHLEKCRSQNFSTDTPMQGLDYNAPMSNINQNDYMAWTIEPHESIPNKFQLMNHAAGSACLDTKYTEYGMTVVEKQCYDTPTQWWSWK